MNLPPNKHGYILFTLKPFFKNVLKEDSIDVMRIKGF